jgi:hypothetical protein
MNGLIMKMVPCDLVMEAIENGAKRDLEFSQWPKTKMSQERRRKVIKWIFGVLTIGD